MAVKEEHFVTKKGLEKLKSELNNLKMVVRPEVIESIKEARAQGDLSENAEYHAAKEKQEQVEKRIKELEYLVDNSVIIEEGVFDEIRIGSTFEIEYVDDNEREEYKIVGSTETDPFENKISNESPIAVAVMGKKVNDVVTVQSPSGNYKIKITEIK